ncbi:MAG TPA: DUF177 domain-containing protein [Dehalococcoidia bacterium]|nr:DUF177 domain-containing protein [Dehalococcoidia bacterium]
MRLHVAPLLKQAIGSVSAFDFEEPSLSLDDTALRRLAGTASLLRTDRGLLVTAHFTASLESRCSRCLADVSVPISIDFQEEYIPVVDIMTGARVHLPESEDVFRIGPDFFLDLREALRQYTLMGGPAKPLCRPDCAGLCPTCGADLNNGPCACPQQPDQRWQALAGLKIAEDEGS